MRKIRGDLAKGVAESSAMQIKPEPPLILLQKDKKRRYKFCANSRDFLSARIDQAYVIDELPPPRLFLYQNTARLKKRARTLVSNSLFDICLCSTPDSLNRAKQHTGSSLCPEN
jgi:hypothetical protein